MQFQTHPAALVDAGGAVLVLILGILVLWARPKRAANRAFFLYAAGKAVAVTLVNVAPVDVYPGARAVWTTSGLGYAAGTVGLVWLALQTTRPTRRQRRLALGISAAAFVLGPVILVASGQHALATINGIHPELHPWFTATYSTAGAAFLAAHVFFLACVALARPELRAGLGPLAAALWIWPALVVGVLLPLASSLAAVTLVAYVTAAVAVSVMLRSWRGDQARTARNLAFWVLGTPILAYAVASAFGPETYQRFGIWGMGRVIAAAIIGYSIVRHQILGFDVKVRWTISRGTIAAAFIAVFVGVQTFVSEFFTNTGGLITGAVAAAGLVFFLAPLQSLAEKVAGAATQDAKPPAAQSQDERLETYRATARSAWSDGAIDAKERALLDTLREALGLSYEQAARIESDAAP